MFIAPFTNLRIGNMNIFILEFLWTYINFCGAATNLMTYSNENQPTKTASATSKKYSSSKWILNVYKFLQVLIFLRDIFPWSCFSGWKAGRVENIRQRVDTTTNRQETMATTFAAFEWCGFSNKFHKWRWVGAQNPVPKSSSFSSFVMDGKEWLVPRQNDFYSHPC